MLRADELKDSVLLVYANKQDMSGCMNPAEITEKLQLPSIKDRVWQVQASSAKTGDGLAEGLDWLGNRLLNAPKR